MDSGDAPEEAGGRGGGKRRRGGPEDGFGSDPAEDDPFYAEAAAAARGRKAARKERWAHAPVMHSVMRARLQLAPKPCSRPRAAEAIQMKERRVCECCRRAVNPRRMRARGARA